MDDGGGELVLCHHEKSLKEVILIHHVLKNVMMDIACETWTGPEGFNFFGGQGLLFENFANITL